MKIEGNIIIFKSFWENWFNEKNYSKRNTIRFITKKEKEDIQKADLNWIKIIISNTEEFNIEEDASFKRKISNITYFEKKFLYFFKTRFVIFSW